MHWTDRGRDRPSVQEGTALSGYCIINYLPSSIATFFYLGQTVQKVSFVYLFI